MIAVILLIVLIATTVGSISGVGGGVLIKPVLDAVTDLTSSQISFLSGTTVLIMTIVSLLRTKNLKSILSIQTVFLGLGAAVGGLAGKELFNLLKAAVSKDSLVFIAQNAVLAIMVVTVLIYTIKKDTIKKLSITNKFTVTAAGLFLGILSSFLGIGGGPINIMALSYLFSMDTKTCVVNSLFTIFLSQSFSFMSTAITGFPQVDFVLLAEMGLLGVIGAIIGKNLSRKMDSRKTDILFICLNIVIIAITIFNLAKNLFYF